MYGVVALTADIWWLMLTWHYGSHLAVLASGPLLVVIVFKLTDAPGGERLLS